MSLRIRIALGAAVPSIVFGAYMFFFIKTRLSSMMLDSATRGGEIVVRHLAHQGRSLVNTQDEMKLKDLADQARGSDPMIVYVEIESLRVGSKVYSRDDEGFKGMEEEFSAGAARLDLSRSTDTAVLRNLVLVGCPIVENGEVTARITAALSGRQLRQFVLDGIKPIFVAVFGLVCIGVILASVMGARIGDSLCAAVDAIRRIADGDYSVRLPTGADEVGLLGDAVDKMAARLKDRDRIELALSRYVSRKVADILIREPSMVPRTGHRKELTLLFCDIKGFTGFIESTEPEVLVPLLNEYLERMTDIVFRHDGTIDKFIGDIVVAFFGDPVPFEDHAAKAVRCAWRMKVEFEALKRKWLQEGREVEGLHMGIGVNTGQVSVGAIGSESRLEYTVIGNAVNVASQLQLQDHVGLLFITERTLERVRGFVAVESAGAIQLLGMKAPMMVFVVKEVRGEPA